MEESRLEMEIHTSHFTSIDERERSKKKKIKQNRGWNKKEAKQRKGKKYGNQI